VLFLEHVCLLPEGPVPDVGLRGSNGRVSLLMMDSAGKRTVVRGPELPSREHDEV